MYNLIKVISSKAESWKDIPGAAPNRLEAVVLAPKPVPKVLAPKVVVAAGAEPNNEVPAGFVPPNILLVCDAWRKRSRNTLN